MEKIDSAITRIGSALDRLEKVIDDRMATETLWGDSTEDVPELRVANDTLETEVRELRARAAEDAKLRAEAAEAVREALSDLRGAVTRDMDKGAPANA